MVISMPHMLRANWLFRMTEIRGVPAYLSAVRRMLLTLALAPVWLLLAILFLLRWPAWTIAGHLALLGLVGILVVELSLYGFHKLPFTCSWLPGQSKVHVVFWGCLLMMAPPVVAGLEERLLNRPFLYVCMILALAIVVAGARWRTTAAARSAEALTFEEEYSPELFSLNLLEIADVLPTSSVGAKHSGETF
jgi:hypothetical protein